MTIDSDHKKTGDGDVVEIALFTGSSTINSIYLTQEAKNCAILDTACTATVCGRTWINTYLSTLDKKDVAKVSKSDSNKIFKFGAGEPLKSISTVKFPAVIAGTPVSISTEVVESDVPLLLSLDAMKKAKINLYLSEDRAEVFGKEVPLNSTTSEHYCIPIDKAQSVSVEKVFAVCLEELDDKKREACVLKLHRQFAHPPLEKFIRLLKDAGAWKEEFYPLIAKVYSQCELCEVYKKTPLRPSVAMPMAQEFNQIVAMDLKQWNKRFILHLVDMWSRYSMSCFIARKYPSEVLNKIMLHWCSVFGFMKGIFHDNGGEFTGDEVTQVASVLDIIDISTGAESPFQNGLCEKVHHVTDRMLTKMADENPDIPQEVLLAWASNARNCLQMHNGFSSHQLVLGSNPNLPNIMTASPPALHGTTSSEVLVQHLNALHSARKAFVQSEADERIRRALRTKIRSSEERYDHGDIVYYKRNSSERWLGPGKVVFQDGKVIFVRHGSTFVRVSANRLIKKGSEFSQKTGDSNDQNIDKGKDVTRNDVSETIGNESTEKADSLNDSTEKDGSSGVALESIVNLKKDDLITYKVAPDSEWKKVKILGRGGKAKGQYSNWYNVEDETTQQKFCVDHDGVEQWKKFEDAMIVLIPRSEHKTPQCLIAKQVELEKLKNFDSYREVENCGQYYLSTTWVLWKKVDEVRARLVVRGFEEVTNIQRDLPTVGKSTMRILFLVAASNLWSIKTTDIKSAFLQSKELNRKVYVLPPKEAEVDETKLWLLKSALYGLNDAARQFFISVQETLIKLDCEQSKLDPALFYKRSENGTLVGCVAVHVDDFLHCGTLEFDARVMDKLRGRFLSGKLEQETFKYVGFKVRQTPKGIIIDQSEYFESIDLPVIDPQRSKEKNSPLTSVENTIFRSVVGQLNWAVQGTRSDKAFELIELSTRFNRAVVSDLVRTSKAMKYIKQW